ncbi:MAG: UvrD-helicase domain-containing protein [Bacteroidales bacterium]|nr:UvrD-helicase domain-containing protein [Bacteroidales bacterium]
MHQPFIICNASAGSGKTFTLVKEYLKMAFAGGEAEVDRRFRSILAITFTNKAAGEMKARIMRELDSIGSGSLDPQGGDMASAILREMPGLKADSLARMARRLHSVILHHYTDLSVSTIDSFMHRIVRTFAHDLGLPMNFDVAIDQQRLIDDAVAALMSLAGTEGQQELTSLLQAFADSRMEDDKGYNIELLMARLARQLFREDVEEHLEGLGKLSLGDFDELHRRYTAEVRRFKTQVAAAGAEMIDLLHGAGLDESVCSYGRKGFYGYFCKLRDGIVAEPSSSARTVAAFEGQKFVGAKASAMEKAAAAAAAPALTAKYGEIKALFDAGWVRYNTNRALLGNLYSMALLSILNREMMSVSRDNEVVHLSLFNRLINRVVQEEGNQAPFIYERLGNRYRHFLIDEFQDTSVKQWHNLVPLIENGVAQGAESLVVGDGKQAIYRFRQGDVRQFAALPRVEGMTGHGQTLGLDGNYRFEQLKTNYRTGRAIIDFNNRFFSWLAGGVYADNPLVQQLYVGGGRQGDEALRQECAKSFDGYVGLNFVGKAEAGDTDVHEAIYRRILQTIEMLVGERGYRYGQIYILARSNASLSAISDYLLQHSGVPQTSTESFYLRESHAVMALVAVLRLVHNRADRVAQADLDYRLQVLGIGAQVDLDALSSLDIYDLCEEAVRQLHLDDIDKPYVASLLNRVAAFAARHRQNVGDFLEWFDEQPTLSAASSDGIDAVQLLTIHKAKGLEAPVVICPLFYGREYPAEMWVDVPGGDGKQLPTAYVSLDATEPTAFEPQRLEEQMLSEVDDLNVLYVALTRPIEQLYVFSPDPHDIKTPRDRDLRYPALLRAFADSEGLEFGDPRLCSLQGAKERKKETVGVGSLAFSDWTERVRVASPSEKALEPLMEERVRFGIYAHDLMAGVLHADDAADAMRRFAARQPLADDERRRLEQLLQGVLANPDAARFFDSRYDVRNECEIMIDGRQMRPDRVVMADGQTWVVDFKTGHPMPKYEEQLRQYCQAIGRMGYPDPSGYIIYLQPEVKVVRMC